MIRPSLALVLLLLTGATLTARQHPLPRALDIQLGRIFDTSDYAVPRFGPARWRPDGTSYSTVEASTETPGASDIVRYDAATGARSVLVAGSRLIPGGQKTALTIDDYAWSADGRRLLVFTNTKKVWRLNTRGDYWVLQLESGTLEKLGGPAPESSLMFAKFSPDGTRVAYVRANNVYVERLSDHRITQLTADGSRTTINGTSDWVYEEELGLRDAFRWSPDGRRIAYWQFDTTGVGLFSLINNTDAIYPAVTTIPYPKAGTTNSAVRIGVVAADGGRTRWMKTPGDPRDTYLARMEWSDDRRLSIQQLNRLQNQNDYLIAEAKDGDVRRVFRDTSKAWVDLVEDVAWIEDGRAFLWLSERDGWQHVFRVPAPAPGVEETETGSGENATLVTKFDADVIEVAGLDEDGGWIYFVASPGNSTQRYLFRSRLDGSSAPERVTPDSQPGTHSYVVAPGGKLAFHTYSRFDVPPITDVVALPAHTALRPLTDTSALVKAVAPAVQPPVEFFQVGVDEGVTLDGWMLKPSHFDATKRYPVIVHVYGEPAGVTVTDRWGGSTMLFHRAVAEAGYIIVSVDNRGTPAPKGAAWRKVVYGTVGELSAKEQAAAVRALAARHAFMDTERIGVWGWSGGGSNTLNAMFRYPDVFQVGVSVAPVPDQKLYDTIYQERYMGVPQQNADGYRRGSPINFAEGLKGRLLLIHGTGDDNVHYQGTEMLINKLITLGKPFDVMVYPNRTHSIAEGTGTAAHVHRLIARYFLQHLPAGGR